MATYLGEFASKAGITVDNLLLKEYKKLSQIQNGLIFELWRFVQQKQLSLNTLSEWIIGLSPIYSDSDNITFIQFHTSIVAKVKSLQKLRTKLRKHKKVVELHKLDNDIFSVNVFKPLENTAQQVCETSQVNAVRPPFNSKKLNVQHESTVTLIPLLADDSLSNTNDEEHDSLFGHIAESLQGTHFPIPESVKELNSLEHKRLKKQKEVERAKNQVQENLQKLNDLKKNIGYYNPRNVLKRETRAKSIIQNLKYENKQLKKANMQLVNYQKQSTTKLQKLTSDLRNAKKGKQHAQQLKSKYKTMLSNNKNTCIPPPNVNKHKYVSSLENELEEAKEMLSDTNPKVCTKENGVFTSDIRLCVMELIGLEVATEKVGPVIQTVAEHIFSCKLNKRDVPNRQTVQNIADEAQYISKRYIAETLATSNSWGLHKDGTTRKKVKLVDTTVKIPGKVMTLGFTEIAREDSDTIVAVTKNQLTELSIVHAHGQSDTVCNEESYLHDILHKLSYLMSDRASNEKLSNEKLREWQNKVLVNVHEKDKNVIHSFYCMAHVLLGFHSYAMKDLMKQQERLVLDGGKLGRDADARYWKFGKTLAAQRMVLHTSDLFGPVGEHHGMKNVWTAACKQKGNLSKLTYYKDNRFNGLFQCSSETIYHRRELTEMLTAQKEIKEANLKLVSLLIDLECERTITIVQALAVMYLKVTGPYHAFVLTGNIPYLEFFKPLQSLYKYLQTCSCDPSQLLDPNAPTGITQIPYVRKDLHNAVFSIVYPAQTPLLKETLQLLCRSFMRTMDVQLVDFLDGGIHSQEPDAKEVARTSFSGVDNLPCERHLGSLDASQRRRPNASLHHHSTVELIKQNRTAVICWIKNKSPLDQRKLLTQARKYGKWMRNKHREETNREHEKILHRRIEVAKALKEKAARCLLKKAKGAQLKRNKISAAKIKRKASVNPKKQLKSTESLPSLDIKVSQYVAVVYNQPNPCWYPGMVTKVTLDEAEVKFMAPTTIAGVFKWPEHDDVDIVRKCFIFECDFNVRSVDSGGRSWRIDNYKHIQQRFKSISNKLFENN